MNTPPPTIANAIVYRGKDADGFDVVLYNGEEYLIGAQVCHVLFRETYNCYRSIKNKGIKIVKCDQDEVEVLVLKGLLQRGTHAATLIAYDEGKKFVKEELSRQLRHHRNRAWSALVQVCCVEYVEGK